MLVMNRPSLIDSKGRRNCDTNTDGGMINTDGLNLWDYLHLDENFSFHLNPGGIAWYNYSTAVYKYVSESALHSHSGRLHSSEAGTHGVHGVRGILDLLPPSTLRRDKYCSQ